jgi:hypothetical protein
MYISDIEIKEKDEKKMEKRIEKLKNKIKILKNR